MFLACFIGIIALVCLYLEFFLPGGILAVCSVFLMLIGAFVFFFNTSDFWLGAVYLISCIVGALFTCLLALKVVRKSKNSFCLKDDQAGFVSASIEDDLVGKAGLVSTELKPAGHVRIEGRQYQAVSQGEFISKDTKIEVVSIKGSHLLVKEKK